MSTVTIEVPSDLLDSVQRRAETQGRSLDEVAAEALNRYVATEMLKELTAGAEERRRKYGIKTDDEAQEYVNRVIQELRSEQRSR